MYSKNLLGTVISFMLIAILNGCSPGVGPSPPNLSFKGSWKPAGLSEIAINNFNQFNGFLYAATDSGLYKTSLKNNKISWKSLGLKGKKVSDVTSLPGNKLLAAILSVAPYLYLSDDQGKRWQPFMNNFGGIDVNIKRYVHLLQFQKVRTHCLPNQVPQ